MRRLLPDSLAAWALLILICGLVVAEVATLTAIVQDRTQNSRISGFFHLSERVSSMSRAIASVAPDARASLAAALSSNTLSVDIGKRPAAVDATSVGNDELAEMEDIMLSRLTDSGITDVRVDHGPTTATDDETAAAADAEPGPVARLMNNLSERYSFHDSYIVSVELADASWINFGIPVGPAPSLWSLNGIVLSAIAIALVLAASVWALRRLTSPYAVLAAAADRLGRDINADALPVGGPREVRLAARAFNAMQERLQRAFADRDQLLAAITHDLRTPTTRLRLRAEFVGDPRQRARMLADLDEIESMTRSVLAFASGSAQPEPREPIDLVSLLRSLCDDSPETTLVLPPETPPRVAYSAEPVALRRCISNLIENAVKYGGCARVSLALDGGAVRIVVDDDGPGIAEENIATVFLPFRRLETSRNRETGGTGLGLTIARAVARAHGGDVTLTGRPEGGLRAEIVLPLAPAAEAARPAA